MTTKATFNAAQKAVISELIAAAVADATATKPRRKNTGDLFETKPTKKNPNPDYVFDGPLDVEGCAFHIWARKSDYHKGYYVSIAVEGAKPAA